MKDIKAIRALNLLQQYIELGEHEHQDFKYLISDARKIARSISAFANNDGGRLIIGVKDNGTIAGVRSEEDIYMIEQAAVTYCRPEVEIDFSAIKAGRGTIVFIATIPRATSRPVQVVESDGTLQAYYRVADENIVAHPLMVDTWRYQALNTGTVISTTQAEVDILTYLRGLSHDAPATNHQIAIACHLSQATTDAALVRLASLSLIQFVYHNHKFMIALPD